MSAQVHVLIVEDEPKIAALLGEYFQMAGWRSSVLDSGARVAGWVREFEPDAVVLDLMLPVRNGLDVCREVRAFSNVPILMLTARVEEIDRLLGLELGADDYICKPFSPREVVARVRAVLRRVAAAAPGAAASHAPSIEFDDEAFEARCDGQSLGLTRVEFRLLRKLLERPGRVLSRARLLDALYEDYRIVSDRTVDSHVKNLRRKLQARGVDGVASVYGVGYRFETPVDGE
ncbi:response regulator [Dokdonella ginsengisoli]|uniref:Response regulator n=1 Tax=Dokdonella ginsengisoli TaxID=363846 RepID=A0ABV9QXA9_9GAMM